MSAQRVKIRIQFEKLGTVRFTSHKDVVRIFERAFGAAGVPVAWSEGFHPHMRMSFGPPLRTGWESREEYMDVTMDGSMDGFASAVNEKLPEGLVITRVVAIDDRTPKLAADMSAVALEVSVAADDAPADASAVSSIISDRFLNTNRPQTSTEPGLRDADVVQSKDALRIRYTSTMNNGRIVTPEDVVSAAIGDPESFRVPIKVVRLAQYVARGDRLVSPLDEGVVQVSI